MKTILKILIKTKRSGMKAGRNNSQELNSYLLNLNQLLSPQGFLYSAALLGYLQLQN